MVTAYLVYLVACNRLLLAVGKHQGKWALQTSCLDISTFFMLYKSLYSMLWDILGKTRANGPFTSFIFIMAVKRKEKM